MNVKLLCLNAVALGRRYFPRCSTFLDNLLHDTQLMETGTETRKERFLEILGEFGAALLEDKQENATSALILSSSASARRGKKKAARTRR